MSFLWHRPMDWSNFHYRRALSSGIEGACLNTCLNNWRGAGGCCGQEAVERPCASTLGQRHRHEHKKKGCVLCTPRCQTPCLCLQERATHGLAGLVEFVQEAALLTGEEGALEALGVRLMTVHGAKGLEFDTVFFCGAPPQQPLLVKQA